MVFTDLDEGRARRAVEAHGDDRLGAVVSDASDAGAFTELARAERADAVLNAVDPRSNPAIFSVVALTLLASGA
jgi:hypothetical protein